MSKSYQFWLTEEQVELLRPQVPKERGRPRVSHRLLLSGSAEVKRNGSR